MKVALVGYSGYWGQNLLRVLREAGHDIAAYIDSTNVDSLETCGAQQAVIATPPYTHTDLAMLAMKAGMDVLVEKPMSLKERDAKRMADYAATHGLVLSVDSTFLHTESFRFFADLAEPVIAYQSTRLAPPMPQATIPAGWDLVVHDLAILQGLDSLGEGVGAQDGPVAQAAFSLPSGGSAFIMASRQWPVKVRDIVIHFESGAYLWNLKGVTTFEGTDVVREEEEPLRRLVDDFARRCENRELEGITDGLHGAEVCSYLERLFPHGEVCQTGTRRVGNGMYRFASL